MSTVTSTSFNPAISSMTCGEPAVIGGGRDVHLRALTISYSRAGLQVTPISELDMYAPSSRVTALVGRSGSGKTSILSCIAAMLRPQSGAVWVGGIEVTKLHGRELDTYRRQHVGVVHQSYNLISSLTALENVAVPLSLAGIGRREANRRASDLLDELGLSSVAKHRPDQMSGGQQQRVAVARALAPNPSVLIADEPTAHLDGTSVADVRSMLRSIANNGRTVILSTHDDRLLSGVDQTIHLSGV
jgi:putative ABC transport system ATP-binding protein